MKSAFDLVVRDQRLSYAEAAAFCKAEIARMERLLHDPLTAKNPYYPGSYEHRRFEENRTRGAHCKMVFPDGWRECGERYLAELRAMLECEF